MTYFLFQWMKCLDHKVKVICHLMVGHHSWVEIAAVKGSLADAKREVQEALKPGRVPGGSKEDNEGVAYAFPDAKGFGGNTTTAALARKVFGSSNMRSRLVQLVPRLYRPAMEKILLNDLILLRLMSCDYKLLPAKIGIEVNEPKQDIKKLVVTYCHQVKVFKVIFLFRVIFIFEFIFI